MKEDKVFLKHILDEANYIFTVSQSLKYEDLLKDETLKRAIARSLEIIGEATKNISLEFREKYKHIEWRELTGLRDKLIHKYFGVKWERVWDVIDELIPELKNKIEAVLKEIE